MEILTYCPFSRFIRSAIFLRIITAILSLTLKIFAISNSDMFYYHLFLFFRGQGHYYDIVSNLGDIVD